MRFVVTGGMGFFGSVLMDYLLAGGHEALSIDRLFDAQLCGRFQHATLDIADRHALREAVAAFGPVDGIFHVAAVLAHDRKMFPLIKRSNVIGTDNVMNVARELAVPRVVFTSSNCVFATNFDKPVDESAPTAPIEEYGRSKLQGEEIVASYAGQVDGVSIRCPTIIAAGRLGLLTILFDFVREGRRLYVIGPGNNRYSFIYAADLAHACFLAMTGRPTGVYHISSDNVPTLRALYSDLYAAAGKSPRIISLPQAPSIAALKCLYALGLSPLGPYHYRMLASNFVMDASKMKADFGWAPTRTNSEMLIEAYRYYSENIDTLKGASGLSPHKSPARAGILNLLRLLS